MENILDVIDPHELGRELRNARKRRNFTQDDAAKVLGVARTTVTAIEKGERRIKAGELMKLARAYGSQISDFVRARPVSDSFQVQFRGPAVRSEEDEAQIGSSVDSLEELARNYLELEQLMHAPLTRKYPPEYASGGLKTEQVAASVALEERNRLRLGDGAVPILRSVLEQDVGLRIFYLPLTPSKFSAIYIYNDQLGGCIAVDILHPEERRRWSLAHDYGHFLAHRYRPSFFMEDAYQRLPDSERFADYFALHFLMPSDGLTRRFTDIRQAKKKITAADLCTLAHYYGVSVAAITRRLEDLRLLPSGLWNRIKESGFKVREAQQQLRLGPIAARAEKLPMRYQYLAIDALDEGVISEGQFATFLQVDRLAARRIAESLRGQTTDVTEGAGPGDEPARPRELSGGRPLAAGNTFEHDYVILDACCVINLCESERMEDVLESIPGSVMVAAYVREKEVAMYDLQPMIERGLLTIAEAESEEEEISFVNYAAAIGDDGEAVTGAIAVHRGWVIATDDRKAISVLSAAVPGLQLVSTPDLVRHWVETLGPAQEVVQAALTKIETAGRYVPRRDHPLRGWWKAMMQ